jgi:hypothetical protein
MAFSKSKRFVTSLNLWATLEEMFGSCWNSTQDAVMVEPTVGGTPVSAAAPLPVSSSPAAPTATNPGLSQVRAANLDQTKQEVKATPGNVLGFKFINPNAEPVYVKFYNAAAAGVTVGTTAPKYVVPVPANDGTNHGVAWITPDQVAMEFSTGITVAATTGMADADTTAPTTDLMAEIEYK